MKSVENFGKYGEAAIKAAKALQNTKSRQTPQEAWVQAAKDIWPDKPDSTEPNYSRMKPCPKNAFLGLCEEGKIIGVEQGTYAHPSAKGDNKKYALVGLNLITETPRLASNPPELWQSVSKKLNINTAYPVSSGTPIYGAASGCMNRVI
ncbi:hypothetical protein [Hoeflea sp.]|uniref:DUF6979 family protein n=1 Tax=Hoeflea sp. TaxID=1940281 RepID=UPI0019B71068|nr:hypothetical protein [Hoeflea sp.]MBC7280918.1 hypothetical protein [Hoeflea sp.]